MYEYIFIYYVKLDLIILDQITNNTPHTYCTQSFHKKDRFLFTNLSHIYEQKMRLG